MIKFAPVNANGALIVSSNRVTQITNSNVISSWYYYDTNLKFDVSYHKNLPENENKNWTIISEFPLVANIVTNLRNIDLVETQKVNEYGNLFLSYNKNTSTTLDMITSNSVTPIGVNFISQSPESVYNWEIFLHVALKIAREFSTQQRLDEARK